MATPIPLEWLCCPVSGQALCPADAALVARMEAARVAGRLCFMQEPEVCQIDLKRPLEAGLVSADGQRFYAVEAGLPLLLPDHALVVILPTGAEGR